MSDQGTFPIKFLSDLDRHVLATEVGSTSIEETKLFLKKRRGLIGQIKDKRKSSQQKANWRRNKRKYMKGIRKFHKSTAGKRFHRKLGRFLSMRVHNQSADAKPTGLEIIEGIKGINSYITHLAIDCEYYRSVNESVEVEMTCEEMTMVISEALIEIAFKQDFSDEHIDLMFSLCETAAVVGSLADKAGKTVEEVERLWKKAKEVVTSQYGKTEDDPAFYAIVVGVLKKMLGITKEKKK